MIPVNPDAIGDPNQTPVVFIGEAAGKALGIPQRDPTPPSPTQHPTGQEVDLDAIRRRWEAVQAAERKLEWHDDEGAALSAAAYESAGDVPALLADLDAAREELRRAEAAILEITQANTEFHAQAVMAEDERDRLRATLATVLTHFTERGHPGKECRRTGWVGVGTIAAWRSELAAVDTYETQTGGTE